MPLLSSALLIQSLGIALFTLSTILILSPTTALSSNTVSILGASMHIRPASYIPDTFLPSDHLPEGHSSNPFFVPLVRPKKTLTTSERELLALFGLVLAFISISLTVLASPLRFSKSTLTARTTSDGKVVRKSSAEVGEDIRLVTYTQTLWQILSAVNVIGSSILVAWIYLVKSERHGQLQNTGEGLDLLANNIVFTFGLSDMLFWGYIYTVVKEERREVLLIRERRMEEDEEDAVNKGEVR